MSALVFLQLFVMLLNAVYLFAQVTFENSPGYFSGGTLSATNFAAAFANGKTR